MSQIVEVLKRDNPMVKDFVMACEQWSEEGVQDGRLIISAKERPVGEHERRYNLQVGFFFHARLKHFFFQVGEYRKVQWSRMITSGTRL